VGFNEVAKKSFDGKSMKPGGGGRFAEGKAKLEGKGLPASEAGAIMAKEGRAKYGAKKMANWSAKGRKRAK
jgi:hypothetical protein